MPVDARMRIESNSKTWLVAVVLQLVQEGKLSLEDTVDRWLPGLLRTHGSEITMRPLMSNSSGLIDDNDVTARRTRNSAISRVSATRNCARNCWRSPPGYERIRQSSLAALVDPARRLAAPDRPARHHLPPFQHRLEHRRPDRRESRRQATPDSLPRTDLPTPPATPHRLRPARADRRTRTRSGYALAADGSLTDTTAWHVGKGADGAIVTDAADEARFLTAFTNGTLLDPTQSYAKPGRATPAAAAAP